MTLYPIDALRTLAQSRDGRTLADVGLGALVRGSATTSSFALLIGAIQFSVFGALRDHVGPLAASALSAAASCVVSVPQEVIKQRLVTKIYPSFRSAVQSIARDEGIRGFYSAWKPTMARNIPFVIITFTTMDFLKTILLRRNAEKRELGIWDNVVLGMSSAFVAGAATNPADVIKTRMMTQAASTQVPYSSAMDCMQTIIRTEGLGTFYSGFKQRSTYMCLLWGMTFAINGIIHREFHNRSDPSN
jgi:solute carrier family 25 S-adenosylmethionine transporter 26